MLEDGKRKWGLMPSRVPRVRRSKVWVESTFVLEDTLLVLRA